MRLFKKNLFMVFGCAGSSLRNGLSSSCREQELPSSCGARASRGSGFSCWGAGALGRVGSGSWGSPS